MPVPPLPDAAAALSARAAELRATLQRHAHLYHVQDAPELPDSPKCQDRRQSYAWCDFAAGEASRVALVRLLSRGRVMIERLGIDPYGRTLATVSVNGVDAGDYLISQGLARPWR